MPVLLRDLLDRHIEAVLLEDARLVCERERRKPGPSRDPDADLHVFGDRWCGHHESCGGGEYSKTTHGCIPFAGSLIASCSSVTPVRAMLLHKMLHNLCRASCALISFSQPPL